MTKLNALLGVAALVVAPLVTGCGKSASYSLMSDTATFTQNSASINGKIDILFVIDNSGSMAASQQAMADNITRFFEKFDAKGFDYQIAVIGTDAYRPMFNPSLAPMAEYRDGVGTAHTSGYKIVTPNTPNRQQVFITNMKQGTNGSGDERPLQSVEAAFANANNQATTFPRADAFFSIIILSDADDLSATTSSTLDNGTDYYANPNMIPLQHYVDFFDAKFGVVNGVRSGKYNINSIGVMDAACKQQVASGGENKIGNRFMQIADMTAGIKGSICGDFGTTLSDISYKIIQLRTRFYLERELDPSTLHVFIDGAEVPLTTNVNGNGYMYNADDNSVSFIGSYVPGPGASISVSFDPTTIK